jgi:hypothetical protein
MEGYSAPGEEVVVPDMHTRKKMMFDRVRLDAAIYGHSLWIEGSPCMCGSNNC